MSDKTDALRKRLEEGSVSPPTWDDIEAVLEEVERLESDLADALDLKAGHGPTALASVVAERDGLRAELAQQAELQRMEREALIGASKAVERILRARIAELEAAQKPVKFSERKPAAGQVVLLWNSFYQEWIKGTPWIPDPLESDDDYLRLHYPLWLPMPPAPEVEA